MNFSKPMMRSFAALVALPLACCAPAPSPAPTPAPAPSPVSTQVPQRPATSPTTLGPVAPDWANMPATPGDWSYRPISGRTQAIFGNEGKTVLVLTCDPAAKRITMFRAGSTRSAVPMRILTETATRDLLGVTKSAENPSIMADINGIDPILDAMAFSKGRFAIETAGMPTLYVPAWPEVTRIMEDCR